MKFIYAAIVISAIAAKAIAETDVVDPVEVGEDLLNEDPNKVADVEVKKYKASAFMSITTDCPNVQFWVKNRKVDDSAKSLSSPSRRSRRSRELYGETFEDGGIEGYAGNNCAPTTAGGDFKAIACHPDANVATHFTLPEIDFDSVVDIYWDLPDVVEEGVCDGVYVRFTCPPVNENDMPSFEGGFLGPPGDTDITNPCAFSVRRRNLRNNA